MKRALRVVPLPYQDPTEMAIHRSCEIVQDFEDALPTVRSRAQAEQLRERFETCVRFFLDLSPFIAAKCDQDFS